MCDVLLKKVLAGLDRLGYSKERAMHRVKIYDNATKGSTVYNRRKFKEDLEVIISGSRREGLANFWESDIDEMIVPERVVCTETGNDYGEHVNLTLDFEGAPAGYTFLKLPSDKINSKLPRMIKWDIAQRDGFKYLKNTQWLYYNENQSEDQDAGIYSQSITDEDQGWMRWNVIRSKFGPAFHFAVPVPVGDKSRPAFHFAVPVPVFHFAVPVRVGDKSLKYDHVLALKCQMSATEKWCNRKCTGNWPSFKVIDKIKGLDAHVVPARVKGTRDEHLQWRVCFTLAEIELIQSFNDVQIKVYGVLKMLAKHILEPGLKTKMSKLSGDVNVPSLSYIMKNIMLWISEEVPVAHFTEKHFTERLMQAVTRLKRGVEDGHLPNNMIPSRNLCSKKLTPEQRQILVPQLEDVCNGGLGFVTQIPQLMNEIANQNMEELKLNAMQRYTREQFLLSIFALPPDLYADVLVQLFDAKTSREWCELQRKGFTTLSSKRK